MTVGMEVGARMGVGLGIVVGMRMEMVAMGERQGWHNGVGGHGE